MPALKQANADARAERQGFGHAAMAEHDLVGGGLRRQPFQRDPRLALFLQRRDVATAP